MRLPEIIINDSYHYTKYYSIKKHLADMYQQANFFVVATPKKGIGKTYSVFHDFIIPDLTEGYGSLYIRWEKGERDTFVSNIENKDSDLNITIPFEYYFKTVKGMKVLYRKSDNKAMMYFITVRQIAAFKGLEANNGKHFRNVYWDEFLTTDNVYVKPKERIESFYQLLGSTFRQHYYRVFMTANNIHTDNVFIDYMFFTMGWPEYGKTHYSPESGIVIDSPLWTDYMANLYNGSCFERNARANPIVHKQLFGRTQLNDSDYSNLNHILPSIDMNTLTMKYIIQIGINKYVFYTYREMNYTRFYIANSKMFGEVNTTWAGNQRTMLETNKRVAPDYVIKGLRFQMELRNLRFREGQTQKIIIDWLTKWKDDTKIIDWTKKEVI